MLYGVGGTGKALVTMLVARLGHACCLDRETDRCEFMRQRRTQAVARSGGRTEGALRVRLAAPGHRGAVHGVSLADDCSKGVSCGGDGQVALWDIHSLSKVLAPQISSAGRMHADMPLAGLVCDSQWLLQHLVLRHVW